MKYPLRFVVSYVQPVTQHFEPRTGRKAPLQSPLMVLCTLVISIIIRMKSEVSTTLRCWLCSTRYTAIRIKNHLKSTSANKIATMKNTTISVTNGSHHVLSPIQHFAVSKDEWDTKEDTGKSMKNALHVLRYAKRHLLDRSNVGQ